MVEVGTRSAAPIDSGPHSASRRLTLVGVTLGNVLTAFGVGALTFMMVMYALEYRDRRFVVGFAAGCALSSVYGFLVGTWPFGTVEAVWAAVALRRWRTPPAMA